VNTKKNNANVKVIETIREFVRSEIRDIIREEWWAEAYDKNLTDDPEFKKKSVLVPDDIKDSIKSWSHKMGLSTYKRSRHN
jgi:hypothetical protein